MGRLKDIIKKTILWRAYSMYRSKKRQRMCNQETIRIWNPDAVYIYRKFPEIEELWKMWIYNNEHNNMGDYTRLYSFVLNIKRINELDVKGCFAELGVYKGNSAAILNYYAKIMKRKLLLFDTFEGFKSEEIEEDKGHENDFKDTSIEYVKEFVGEAIYRKGFFPESLDKDDYNECFAFVSLDCDLYKPMIAGLRFFYPRMSRNGMIFCHDYSSGSWEGARRAIDEFYDENNVSMILLPDKSGSLVIIKD